MEGLGADVARLALRVVGARLDRDRDGLFVFFVGVVLFRVAGAVYSLADLLVAAAPVVLLASGTTISGFAPQDTARIARRVLGGAHPTTADAERDLIASRSVLRSREAGHRVVFADPT